MFLIFIGKYNQTINLSHIYLSPLHCWRPSPHEFLSLLLSSLLFVCGPLSLIKITCLTMGGRLCVHNHCGK